MLDCTKCNRTLPNESFHRASKETRGYAWWCKECKRDQEAAHRLGNPEKTARKRENLRRWRLKNKQRSAYLDQKNNAQKRGIDFLFSFDEWVEWWGDDFDKRGCKLGELVMARAGDCGPYSPANVHKATCSENLAEYWGSLGHSINSDRLADLPAR